MGCTRKVFMRKNRLQSIVNKLLQSLTNIYYYGEMSFAEKLSVTKGDVIESFADKALKNSGTPINLIRCKDSNGIDCYFFVMCDQVKVKQVMKDAEQGRVDLDSYGRVLESGWGKNPSEEVKKIMRDKYNFDPDTMLNDC